MNFENTLNNWIISLKDDIKHSPLFNTDFNSIQNVRILKNDYISIFNDLLQGKEFQLINVNNCETISQAISDYQKVNKIKGDELFTNKDLITIQNIIKINKLELENSGAPNTFFCFGVLKYNLDYTSTITLSAPLILVPIKINQLDNKVIIEGIKNEFFLNDLLIEKIKQDRKLDLSFPLNSGFSLADYLYYVNTKVRFLNWSVENINYISNYNIFLNSDLHTIEKNKEKLLDSNLIKNISYLNSEFYHFNNKSNSSLLDSKYLSLLEMENEEHSILKKIANRESMVIKTINPEDNNHLLGNIIQAYLLNNRKVLVIYSNDASKELLSQELLDQGIASYVCDLDYQRINKEKMLTGIIDYDKYLQPFNSNKYSLLNKDVKNYYLYKNNFKLLLNALRTNKNLLNISINKLINEYYSLDEYPLINVTINDATKMTSDTLSEYLSHIHNFSNNINSLSFPIRKHPFYGFSRTSMKKDDYIPLKQCSIDLSTLLMDANTIFSYGSLKYGLPKVNNLKEMKALLNILSFVYTYDGDINLLSYDNLDDIYDQLIEIKLQIESLNNTYISIENIYSRRISFLNNELINRCFNDKTNKKLKSKVTKLLCLKNMDQNKYNTLIDSLNDYYTNKNILKAKIDSTDQHLIKYIQKNKLSDLRLYINQINIYKNNLKYIKNKNDFEILKLLSQKDTYDLKMLRRCLQSIFNGIYRSEEILQSYFDLKTINFSTLDINQFQSRVDLISKNFSTINEYLIFYSDVLSLNKLITNLGSELLNYDDYDNYDKIFLKKFYYDFLTTSFKSNSIFKNYSKNNLLKDLKNFSTSNEQRKNIISDIIENYFNDYLRKNILSIKKNEGLRINNELKKELHCLTLSNIIDIAQNSIYNLKPCIMCSYRTASLYLKDNYNYDAIIYLANDSMKIKDVLTTIYRAPSIIVFKDNSISNTVQGLSKDSFITNSQNTYQNITYKPYNQIFPLQANITDIYVKKHIMNTLKAHGFEVGENRSIGNYTIDILARLPNTKMSTAIIIDHLPYNSPESTYKSFNYENDIIKLNGYNPYRIIPSTYFLYEQEENKSLFDYIIHNSGILPSINSKRSIIPLMDYLFQVYIDPHQILHQYEIKNLSFEELATMLIYECAPISINELDLLLSKNITDLTKKLKCENKISIENGFIYIPNRKVVFRRVNRNSDYIRHIDTVCDKEIYDAIYSVIAYRNSIEKELLIKMILRSLGYKKMNNHVYTRVMNSINFLLQEKVIFIENDILYKDL